MVLIVASNLGNGNRLGLVVISERFDEKRRKRHCSQQRYLELRCLRQGLEARMEPMSKVVSAAPAPLILTSGASSRLNALLSLRALRALFLLLNMVFLLLLTPLQRGAARFASGVSPPPSRCSVERAKGDDGCRERKRKWGSPVVVRVPAAMVPRRAGGPRDAEVALRRAMAIRRMDVEEEDRGNGRSKKEFSLFVTARGDTLFTRSWSPITAPLKGLVVLLHGLNEHSGRYDSFAKRLNDNGFKVYGMDWTAREGIWWRVTAVNSFRSKMLQSWWMNRRLSDPPPLSCSLSGGCPRSVDS